MGTGASKQHEVLQSLVADLRERHPDAGILLTGSLRDGRAHGGSDIDLLLVVGDVHAVAIAGGRVVHTVPGVKVIEAVIDDVPVGLVCIAWSVVPALAREPWRNYQFGQATILHDPDGAALPCQQSIRGWFAEHPDVAELWRQQQAEHARVKAAKRNDGRDLLLEFPTWEAFADHVHRIVTHAPRLADGT